MKNIDKLTVKYHGIVVGSLSLTPDNRLCAFEYDKAWLVAPAYDLTLCTEGYNGQHATSVNGSGNPSLQDFITVGVKFKMTEKRCREIFRQVYDNGGDLVSFSGKF